MARDGLPPALRGGPLLIGHRGAAGLAPENTMPSFREAVARWDVDMIELDVRASADGHCVVFHDATVDRTTDGTGPVAERTLAELRELDAGARFVAGDGSTPFAGQGVRIPAIDEVLESFPDTRFTFEVKIGTAQEPMFDAIRRHGADERVIAAGMDWRDRLMFAHYAGAVSGSTRDVRAFYGLHRAYCGRFWTRCADVFQVPERQRRLRIVTARFVRDARAHGIPVHVWTVNDAGDMRRLLDWGVDGIITDRPDIGARVMADRLGRPLPAGLR
ncbi:MAG TPA: glycerophosphodiester phosphodiesterase [Longimicrobiales bacterium]|nr:glycerophosphodiester phosphodiesterase [Longimicrobiales bacterium]